MIQQLIFIIHVVAAFAIIGLVLLQHGKGADMGAAFGSGSAGSLFGASGASNFLSKSTAACAAIFFSTSLGLTYFSAPKSQSGVLQRVDAVSVEQKAPAGPVAPDAAGKDSTKVDDSKSKEIPK